MTTFDSIQKAALESYQSITFITTYQCTAACKECCFESSPTLSSPRLDSQTMISCIDEAIRSLPSLGLVVFSGGECFMLKEQLFITIAYATARGLKTRCVTNGFWGKTEASARRTASRLAACGVSEINISTGLEHQEWVPEQSVVNAGAALVDSGIFTFITLEKDSGTSGCWRSLSRNNVIQRMLRFHSSLFCLSSNSWMPFHVDAVERGAVCNAEIGGCKQLFSNLVITPYKKISACCGLTFEHISELQVGQVGAITLADASQAIADDFLKVWLHIDGPHEIVKKVGGAADKAAINKTVHICQACAVMHQSPSIRAAITESYLQYVPEVMAKFVFAKSLRSLVQSKTEIEK